MTEAEKAHKELVRDLKATLKEVDRTRMVYQDPSHEKLSPWVYEAAKGLHERLGQWMSANQPKR